jgi:peptidoglycan/LPS O-acetylase OafA/YrhL
MSAAGAAAVRPNWAPPSAGAKPGRIQVIHCLRGLASFAVCWFHFTNGNPAFLPAGALKSSGIWGGLGVEMFFVISGFVLPYSLFAVRYQPRPRNYALFLWKRISRLDPPYLASMALVLVLAYVSLLSPWFRGTSPAYTAGQVALHLGYLNAFFHKPWLNIVYWSLAIEFQYYIIVGLLFPLITSRKGAVRAALLAMLGLSGLLVRDEALVFPYFFLFMMGFSAFQFRVGLVPWWELLCVLAIAVAGASAVLTVPAALVGIVTAAVIATVNGTNLILAWLGDLSYSLYLVHVPVGGRIINTGERLGGSFSFRLLFLAGALAASFAAAYGLYRFVEQPCQKYASTLRFKNS